MTGTTEALSDTIIGTSRGVPVQRLPILAWGRARRTELLVAQPFPQLIVLCSQPAGVASEVH